MPQLTAARKRTTLELVANFLDHMEDALDHIETEMRYTSANVYPTQTALAASTYTDQTGKVHTVGSGGGGSKGGSISPVERKVVDAQARLRDIEWNLWEQFNAIVSTAHAGSRQAQAAAKRIVPTFEHARCNRGVGKRLDGHTTWQNPDCDNFPGDHPVIGGMCDDCLNLYNTYRRANGLDVIARDVEALNYRSLSARNLIQGPGGRFERAS